ncbi:sulfatase-modifying factor [Niabella ginsenosidivorans]|uniref:Sulfatase-modifying factor n=1 Tax=Niabella ginsenosidivorans TaxID=1176587 RepID=A0A1A9I7F0_9BACT|nr:SUMF1/EgtB/PvdO family nonheme iron enzyme [Niabella ginsenosidivorans]ANH82630.1 sulfatase-modifying factor [Niabella ginsenosidivorans]
MKQMIAALLSISIATLNAQEKKDTDFKKYEQTIPGSDVKFTMIPIPAGTFTIGRGAGDPGNDADELPQVTLQIDAFYMGEKEVTFDEYALYQNDESLGQNVDADAVTRPTTPYIDLTLGMGKEGGFPANSMQQRAAIMYCKWLYTKTGVFYRLPTEAEWEYAARAGSATPYFFGTDEKQLADYAWYAQNSDNKYHKTGLKKPNPWGLYDIYGNVAEWVLDQYQPDFYKTLGKQAANPVRLPDKRNPRIVRGGSFKDAAMELRSANRTESDPLWNRRDPQIPKSKWWNADAPFIGFRLVRPVQQPTKEEAEKFFSTYIL